MDQDNQIEPTRIKIFIDYSVKILNITDKHELACTLINYFRYCLRFISAYIIVVFTLQRLTVVITPLKKIFKSKRSAWYAVLLIILIALLINLWIPFVFEIQIEDGHEYCEIKKKWKAEYFIATNIYIVVILVVPMITIFTSNILIIFKTKKSDLKRKNINEIKIVNLNNSEILSGLKFKQFPSFKTKLTTSGESASNTGAKLKIKQTRKQALSITKFSFKFKPMYLNVNQMANETHNKTSNSNKITTMLILISFSYAILNLPYLITW